MGWFAVLVWLLIIIAFGNDIHDHRFRIADTLETVPDEPGDVYQNMIVIADKELISNSFCGALFAVIIEYDLCQAFENGHVVILQFVAVPCLNDVGIGGRNIYLPEGAEDIIIGSQYLH